MTVEHTLLSRVDQEVYDWINGIVGESADLRLTKSEVIRVILESFKRGTGAKSLSVVRKKVIIERTGGNDDGL